MLYQVGQCSGSIGSITYFLKSNSLVCIPADVTGDQITRVIVKQLETHPEQLHLRFELQAAYALGSTWPCRTQR